MRTETINIYKFGELNEQAKEKAKEKFEYYDFWQNERRESFKAAKELYKKLETETGDEISGLRLYKFIQNNILPELRKKIKYYKTEGGHIGKYAASKLDKTGKERFSKIKYEECSINLTGYCADYDFLEPIFDFLKNPDKNTTNTDLMGTDLVSIYERLAQQDYESFYKDDNFEDHCEANGYEFTENGDLF